MRGAIPSLRDFWFGREFCFCLPTLRWLTCHMGAWLGCAQGFLIYEQTFKSRTDHTFRLLQGARGVAPAWGAAGSSDCPLL